MTADLTSPTAATYADIEALPPHVTGELVDGVLHATPRPAARHASVETGIAAELLMRFQRGIGGPGGWIILAEPELHLGSDVLVPDIAGWRQSNLPDEQLQRAAIDVAPDWVCEIASPSTRRWDRNVKVPRYHAARVGHVWLVEVSLRGIEVLRYAPETWYLAGWFSDEPDARIEPFDNDTIDLSAWWPPVPSDEP